MKTINSVFDERGTRTDALETHIGEAVTLLGSIYRIREMSGFAFVLIRTRTGVVQCTWGTFSSFPLSNLTEEAWVRVEANVVEEPRARVGYELQLLRAEVLSAPTELPPVVIHNKRVTAGLDTLLDYRPLTMRNERERAIFLVQAALCAGIRSFLESRQFREVHTPKLVFAGAEGGANIFELDYFGRQAFLTQSPQFYKQMLVGVFERVYEIAPVFRAEKHDTARHLNEYTSVDVELGFIGGVEDIMMLEAAMLKHTFAHVAEACAHELARLGVALPQIEEIPCIPFHEAKELLAKKHNRPVTDWQDFEPEEERLLSAHFAKEAGTSLVFVTHYPSGKRPFYAMDDPKSKDVTLSFDLLFEGTEITTGGQRIHNYRMQVDKMTERGMDAEDFESYLMAHKYGLPPHGGFGLGLERLTQSLLKLDNIRYATMFPRDIKRLVP